MNNTIMIVCAVMAIVCAAVAFCMGVAICTTRKNRDPRAARTISERNTSIRRWTTAIICGLLAIVLGVLVLVEGVSGAWSNTKPRKAVKSALATMVDIGIKTYSAYTEQASPSPTPSAIPSPSAAGKSIDDMTDAELLEEYAHLYIDVDALNADAEFGHYSRYVSRSTWPSMNHWKNKTLKYLGQDFQDHVALPILFDQFYYDVKTNYIRKTGNNVLENWEQVQANQKSLEDQIEDWKEYLRERYADGTLNDLALDDICQQIACDPIFGDMVARGINKYCPIIPRLNKVWYAPMMEKFTAAFGPEDEEDRDPDVKYEGVQYFMQLDTDDEEVIDNWNANEKLAHMQTTDEYFYEIAVPLIELVRSFEPQGFMEIQSVHNYHLPFNALLTATRTREAEEQEKLMSFVLSTRGKSGSLVYLIGFNFFDKRFESFNEQRPPKSIEPQASASPTATATASPGQTAQPTESSDDGDDDDTPPGQSPTPSISPSPSPSGSPTPSPGGKDPSESSNYSDNTDEEHGKNTDKTAGGEHQDSVIVSQDDTDYSEEKDKQQSDQNQKDQELQDQISDGNGGTTVGGDIPDKGNINSSSSGSGTTSSSGDGNGSGGGSSGGEGGGSSGGGSGGGGNTANDKVNVTVEEPT